MKNVFNSNQLSKITLSVLFLCLAFTIVVSPAHAVDVGSSDHRFFIQLPDGKLKPESNESNLKGAQIHKVYKATEQDASVILNYCAYPEFESVTAGDGSATHQTASNFHCSTFESCYVAEYGAPYLPASFNSVSQIYSVGDASYSAFNGWSFTQMLGQKAPAYLNAYVPNNIRGFVGAKWQGTVNYQDGTGVKILQDPPAQPLGNAQWGTIPGYSQKQSWGAGEVYYNPLGGNVLQTQITWKLVLPAQNNGGGGSNPAMACKAIQPAGSWNANEVKIGDSISFACVQVAGLTKTSDYQFRVIEPNGTVVDLGNAVSASANAPAVSKNYSVTKAGSFKAQCRICPNGQCHSWTGAAPAVTPAPTTPKPATPAPVTPKPATPVPVTPTPVPTPVPVPGSGSIQATDLFKQGSNVMQAVWRNNIGYTRTLKFNSDGTIFFNDPEAKWSAGLPLANAVCKGSGSITAQSLYYFPNGVTAQQTVWRGTNAYIRDLTVSNGSVQFPSDCKPEQWAGPLGAAGLPGGDSAVTAQVNLTLPNGTLYQSYWKGTKEFNRIVQKTADGKPDFDNAPTQWGDRSADYPDPSVPTVAHDIVQQNNNTVLEAIWKSNGKGYVRTIPLQTNIRFGQAGSWSAPITLSGQSSGE